ncbi:MAG: HEAT repeat domain-containing protein [Elusimicrobiales bacterium]
MWTPEEISYLLQFGEPQEKLEAMRKLEEIAKECRSAANPLLAKCDDPAKKEKLKPWREFRKRIGFPLFDLVLDISKGPAGTELRDLAADILAHLWHPSAVDRLVEDLLENGDKLRGGQFNGIFENLGGIGNEPAARALLRLWDEGYRYEVIFPLGSCNSKVGNAFLMRQARENPDATLRGYCILALRLEPTEENGALLLEKARSGDALESSAAIQKIGDMNMASLVPALISIHNQSDDHMVRESIFAALREMRLRRSGNSR